MTTPPKATYRNDYAPPAWVVKQADLRFDLRDGGTIVDATLHMQKSPEHILGDSSLILDGEHLELLSVTLNEHPLKQHQDYVLDNKSLTIISPPSSEFVLATRVRIHPDKNTALEGLFMSRGRYVTQCEAEGFRRITYFIDRPDVMARYTVTIEADQSTFPILLSNGNPIAQGKAAEGRHWARWEDPFPKPCYLFALVAGAFDTLEDHFVTTSGRKVTLRIFSEPGSRNKCTFAMESLKKAMAWDEKVFGLEYDLDLFMIVAVDDFNAGAMENKGLNIFNSKAILARPETATDVDYGYIEGVVAHEYFHNWTGDRVTCRDWFQLTLKEGLTVFRDQEFSADMNSRVVQRIEDVKRVKSMQFKEDASPLAHPIRPDSYVAIENFYTVTVYEKGAEVIRMMNTLAGSEGFRKGMDLYFKRHDGQAVTCDDFVAAMADANHLDLTQFKRWYSQAGTPVLEAEGTWNPTDSTYTLTLRQSCPPTPEQPVKEPFHIPVAIGLVGDGGVDIPLQIKGEKAPQGTTRVLSLTAPEQTFTFIKVPSPPQPSLLRNFSAPVILKTDQADEDFAFLAAHDSDLFNRWNASQTLALNLLKDLTEDVQQGRELAIPELFLEAFERPLLEKELDPAFAAHVLSLPSENDIALDMAIIHVDAIHTARDFVRQEISRSLRPLLLEKYTTLHGQEKGDSDGLAIGRRALKNLCLEYLSALPDALVTTMAKSQFDQSPTMTDVLAALRVLADMDEPERVQALQTFENRWRAEPLVMDKWFSVQAMSQRTDTLDRVKSLMSHVAFNLKNPNRVRALLGVFSNNPVCFHDINGRGYNLLAETILMLDKLSPKVAATLCKGAFSTWARHEPVRRQLMRARLEYLKAMPNLSIELFEVVEKSLVTAT